MEARERASTNQTYYLYAVEDVGGTNPGEPKTGLVFGNITGSYVRPLAVRSVITMATQTVTGAHSDGGFVEIDATNMPGLYRFDAPDLAQAAGVDEVLFQFVVAAGSNAIIQPLRVKLGVPVDVTQHLGAAAPALVGGRYDASVGAMAANVLTAAAINAAAITSAKFGAGAIDANAIAANAIGSSEFSQGAADKMWATASRLLTGNTNLNDPTVAEIWDHLVTAITQVGSIGKLLKDEIKTGHTVEVAKAVWDRVLTGALHNIANSAGRRLRQLQERGIYQDGAIWIDTVNGTAGTEDFENGTSFNPVDNLADALTLAASLGLARFRIAPGSSLTFASTLTNKQFVGSSWTLALGGQEITGTLIVGAEVSGTALMATGHADFANCDMGICTLGAFELLACGLEDKLTLSAAANYHFDQCFHHAASGISAIIDFGAAVLNTVVHMHHHSGPVEIQNLGQAGTDKVIYEGFGALTLNANCVGGTVNIRGNITLVNNGSGMTINDDARIDTGQVATAVGDEVMTELAAIPGASPTLRQAAALLYMALRNQVDVDKTALTKKIHKDDGTVLATKALTDDGTTYSEAKMA